eukprot:TRINITY_DN6441_c0_g1_i1.p1 TRINITY_DN6441_c0_g1~~TRINITY_DN6441_c0_g1_i1.p1  ORF type:complete len:410 (-),score=47.63 TRINITY_DN6441_c0_g1_i1:59-1288(-)
MVCPADSGRPSDDGVMSATCKSGLPTVFSGVCLAPLDVDTKDEEDDALLTAISPEVRPGKLLDSLRRQTSTPKSIATSSNQFAEPAQTLLFLDWDDTLFPTTELFSLRKFPHSAYQEGSEQHRAWEQGRWPEELKLEMRRWQDAVLSFLSVACALSDRCVIVTNAKKGWVDRCINRFVPELRQLFERKQGGLKIVHAMDTHLQEAKLQMCPQIDQCTPCWVRGVVGCFESLTAKPRSVPTGASLTAAKHRAMKTEALDFYSRYIGQTWKNIVSIGDMRYEHNAVLELSEWRSREPDSISSPRERLRTKAILFGEEPRLKELTMRLEFLAVMLPACVRWDGDFDLDLSKASDPLQSMSQALKTASPGKMCEPCNSWQYPDGDHDNSIERSLDDLAFAVSDAFQRGISAID